MSVNVPEELQQEIQRDALRAGVSVSEYIRRLLMDVVDEKLKKLASGSGLSMHEYASKVLAGAARDELKFETLENRKRPEE